jgi:transposase, IS5 family
VVEALFKQIDGYLVRQGYIARSAQLHGAPIMPAPRNHNTREKNKATKKYLNVDRKHKLVRRYHVSNAALHDIQALGQLLMQGDTGSDVWSDSSYRSEEMEANLRARALKSRIHRKGKRDKPLTERGKSSNRIKPAVCARVEHVFDGQINDVGGSFVRTIGLIRAMAKIGMKNLAYNL